MDLVFWLFPQPLSLPVGTEALTAALLFRRRRSAGDQPGQGSSPVADSKPRKTFHLDRSGYSRSSFRRACPAGSYRRRWRNGHSSKWKPPASRGCNSYPILPSGQIPCPTNVPSTRCPPGRESPVCCSSSQARRQSSSEESQDSPTRLRFEAALLPAMPKSSATVERAAATVWK